MVTTNGANVGSDDGLNEGNGDNVGVLDIEEILDGFGDNDGKDEGTNDVDGCIDSDGDEVTASTLIVFEQINFS